MSEEKTYMLTMYQGGGCDYTIGCGYRFETFSCLPEEAVDKAIQMVEDFGGEDTIEEAYLYVIEADATDILDELAGRNIQEQEEEAERQKLAKLKEERAEYERLKEKFEGEETCPTE